MARPRVNLLTISGSKQDTLRREVTIAPNTSQPKLVRISSQHYTEQHRKTTLRNWLLSALRFGGTTNQPLDC